MLGATLLFALAPFGAFMFGSHMNHVTTLMWLLVATLGLANVVRRDEPQARWAFLNGFGLGAAAAIRPLDAFAFAVPAAVWLLALAWRDKRRWVDVVASGIGVAIPFGAMMLVNAQTTGSPFLFGYEVLWGKAHGLGFHTAPWGAAHTPSRGLELISLYVTRLQTYLFETPFPSMLPVIASLALTKRLSALDRYLLVSATLLGAFYFAYWHDGFFLGPRFVFPWLPVLILFAARLPRLVRERFGRGRVWVGTNAALATGALMAVGLSLPERVMLYEGALTSMRADYTAESKRAGVKDALVFVRESWGAQLTVRMWERGISRSAAAALYHGVDACLLDKALRDVEARDVRGAKAEAQLGAVARRFIARSGEHALDGRDGEAARGNAVRPDMPDARERGPDRVHSSRAAAARAWQWKRLRARPARARFAHDGGISHAGGLPVAAERRRCPTRRSSGCRCGATR